LIISDLVLTAEFVRQEYGEILVLLFEGTERGHSCPHVARATDSSGERLHYYAALGGIADKSVRAPINYADY